DGAIISPIFMIGKTDEKANLNAVADFLGGKTVAEILSHQGLFPSLNPEVDNRLSANTKFMWLGWDTINKGNLNQAFDACQAVFNANQL
ncbi:MAG TPA: ABC transporter substrate-binding protein, partial [Bacteroidales bacterium]|nr:ABC transporter substrate-binding protein [Bacteroidales bacterium]